MQTRIEGSKAENEARDRTQSNYKGHVVITRFFWRARKSATLRLEYSVDGGSSWHNTVKAAVAAKG